MVRQGKKALKQNSGNGLILVLVIAMVVTLLGVALLSTSYTSYMVKVAERKSNDTFATAEDGMDLIRAGLLNAESNAIASGYAKVLNSFSDNSTNTLVFKTAFFDRLQSFQTTKIDGSEAKPLFPNAMTNADGTKTIRYYSISALENYLPSVHAQGDSYTLQATVVAGNNSDYGSAVQAADNKSVTLRGIKLTYTREDGYITSVTTDITMAIPEISLRRADIVGGDKALQNFTAIADKGIRNFRTGEGGQTPDGGTIEGSIYAGMIEMKGGSFNVADNQSMVVGRTLLENGERTSGDITFLQGGQFTQGSGSTLWINNIQMENNGTFVTQSNSKTLVADDLMYEGEGSVTLRGSYYGFGAEDTAEKSSSIIFNSTKKGMLDVTDIQSLLLGGRSFVQEKANSNNMVAMGSSVTAKPEQVAYLVPSDFMDGGKNPDVVSADEADARKSEMVDRILSNKNKKILHDNTLADYGINSASDIRVLTYSLPGDQPKVSQYYFLNFSDQSKANAYFRDYFTSHKGEISRYLDAYANLRGFEKGGSFVSSSTSVKKVGEGYEVTPGGQNLKDEGEDYARRYMNLSQTLSEDNSNEESTPFWTYINKSTLDAWCEGKEGSLVPVAWHVKPDVAERRYNKNKVVCRGKTYGSETIGADGPSVGKMEVAGYCAVARPGVPIDASSLSGGTKCNFLVVDGDVNLGKRVVDGDVNLGNGVVDGDVNLGNGFDGIIMCSGYLNTGGAYLHLQQDGINHLRKSDLWNGTKNGSGLSKGDDWEMDEIVTYSNWKKD